MGAIQFAGEETLRPIGCSVEGSERPAGDRAAVAGPRDDDARPTDVAGEETPQSHEATPPPIPDADVKKEDGHDE